MGNFDTNKKKSHFIEVDGGLKLHVETMGFGEPVLCLSGFANTNMNFHFLAPFLKDTTELYMIDNRGMGKSDRPTQDYDFKQLATDALEVMNKFGVNEFSVIGISMGGFVAQEVARLAPQKVKKLALLATKSAGPEFPITYRVTAEGFTNFMAMDFNLGNRLAVEKYVAPSFVENHREQLEEIIKVRAEKEAGLSLEQALRQLRSCDKWLEENFPLEEITCPTLIMTGEKDNFIVLENAQILNKRIKNSKIVVMPDTSHLFFFEKAKQTAEIIANFFK